MRSVLVHVLVVFVACGGPTPPPSPAASKPEPREASNAMCASDDSREVECELPGGAIGWCGSENGHATGRCKAVCPPGFSYTSTSTSCYRRCGSACKTCRNDEALHIRACADPGGESVVPTP